MRTQGITVLLWLLPTLGHAISPDQAVQQGNALYHQGQYREAAQHYATAGQSLPESAAIHYNQGNAAYKQQHYIQALEHYTQALQAVHRTGDRVLEGKILYNLGNVAYQQALRAQQRPQEALPHVQSAITHYRDSLDVAPQQREVLYNLELAYRFLQQLRQAQQQGQPSPQGRQPHAGQSSPQPQAGQQASPPSSPPQDQPRSAGQRDRQEAPQEQGRTAAPREPEMASTPQDQGKQEHTSLMSDGDIQTSPASSQQALSPAEAARLLAAIRDHAREAERQRTLWRRTRTPSAVEKDW